MAKPDNMKKTGTKRYILRALRYFLKLMVLLAAIYLLMFVTGSANVSARQMLTEQFTSNRGLLLIIALAVLSGIYPSFGFVRRRIGADIVGDRELILKAFHNANYRLSKDEGNRMVFNAASPGKRIWMAFDDRVTVTADGDGIVVEGIRKEVVQVMFRMETYLENRVEE